ncbi:MAG: hypothetical protein ACK2TV_07370, partial [Anaerolineales bacterium]
MPEGSSPNNSFKLPIEEFIKQLIQKTTDIESHSDNYSIIEAIEDYLSNIERAYRFLSKRTNRKKISSSGVEWFLDNYYVIQEASELVQEDLPEDYFSKLPSIYGSSGIPRIYQIAEKITDYFEIEIVQSDLDDFLRIYQKETALKMSELWALPLMLRLIIIEILSENVFNLIDDQHSLNEKGQKRFRNLRTDEIIARSLRTLHRYNRIDWKKFFETHAVVHHILSEDPTGTYPLMNFETRDHYRKVIEGLAENSNLGEIDVARTAIKLSQKSITSTIRARHVGYYLIGDGRDRLRNEISYVYNFKSRLQKFFFDHKTAFYLGSIVFLTATVVVLLTLISQFFGEKNWQLLIIAILSLIPASSVAVNLINSILTTVLPPKILPKMDFSKKIPKQFRTMVAIPALLTDKDEVDYLLRQIER